MAKTALPLFRSVRIEQFPNGTVVDRQAAPEILYPDFDLRELPGGKTRDAGIRSFSDDKGERWVREGGGTSLFDRANVFKAKGWLSFEIPEGTDIPAALKIHFTDYSKRFEANHYQIECAAKSMRMDGYKGLWTTWRAMPLSGQLSWRLKKKPNFRGRWYAGN